VAGIREDRAAVASRETTFGIFIFRKEDAEMEPTEVNEALEWMGEQEKSRGRGQGELLGDDSDMLEYDVLCRMSVLRAAIMAISDGLMNRAEVPWMIRGCEHISHEVLEGIKALHRDMAKDTLENGGSK
jgi:hypothetical protein